MKKDILTLAKKLISIPSIEAGELQNFVAILDVAKKHLSEFNYTSFSSKYPSILFNNQNKETKKFKIILNAHLDVIPGQASLFYPYEKGGRLYGRGAIDMKAAGAVMILLFKELAPKISYPLGLQLVTDEEVDQIEDGAVYQIQQGVRGEFIISGECNSNFRIGTQAKGRKLVTLHVKGQTSHSAYTWLGKNAIWRMYEILEPIMKAFPVAQEETHKTTVSIIGIHSDNTSTTKIPDNCTALLDIRFAPEDKESIIPQIRALLPQDVTLSVENIRPVHFTNINNTYISLLRKITKDVHGKDLPLRFAHGSSDAAYFSEAGCNAVEFGPIGEGAHHDDEWVDIQSLVDYYAILKSFLLEVNKMYTETTQLKKKFISQRTAPIFLENRTKE